MILRYDSGELKIGPAEVLAKQIVLARISREQIINEFCEQARKVLLTHGVDHSIEQIRDGLKIS